MMRFKVVILGILICLVSCTKNDRMSDELKRFYGQRVVLPLDCMLYMSNQKADYMNFQVKERNKFVIYYDSTECSSCRLKTLYKWREIMDSVSSPTKPVDFYFVFHIPRERLTEMRFLFSPYIRDFTVYIDTTRIFERSNPCLPHLSQMRSFMLNEKDTVILVGNPVRNRSIKKMMLKMLGGSV